MERRRRGHRPSTPPNFNMGILLLLLLHLLGGAAAAAAHDYSEALSKSILFYEAQRSGRLPSNQRVKWRSHSALNDGKASGVDLVGGYYDAGDNVKFGLPMAFTVTMLSWSVIEYGRQMSYKGERRHALDAIKWGTDYFIKAHPQPNLLYGEVGDGNSDHYCWQRPEEMTTDRTAYKIDPKRPGSDLAGETAAAMAAASIVFRTGKPKYSAIILTRARQLFSFADRYRAKYDTSITVARKYYGSVSGYYDELLWAAAWLYKATREPYYLNYLGTNGDSMGGTGWAMTQFSWDVKYAGVQVLVSKFLMQGRAGSYASVFRRYQQKAEYFMCSCLGKGSSRNVQKTPGGLMYLQSWNNMQFVTSASFLMTVYSDYLSSSSSASWMMLRCPNGRVSPNMLLGMAKSQVDYILGDNPRATSYMVGYGNNYPLQIHHRGASIVSIKVNPTFVTCRGGYSNWYSRKARDPNVLAGALVGGPDAYDNFADHRNNYEQTEPATYNNAPFTGVLARLAGGSPIGYNQLFTGDETSKKPSPPAPTTRSLVVTLRQRLTSSWQNSIHKGKKYQYRRYSGTITNRSTKTLKNLRIKVNKLYGPLWGLNKWGHYFYSFPSGMKALPPGRTLQFVYVHASSAASVSIASYTLS